MQAPPVALWRVSRFLDVLVCRCRARLQNVLVSFLKYLVTARPFVVGPLLVKKAIIMKVNDTVFVLNFVVHVSLQVYREPASMTTYPLPAEVQMFLAVKCLWPTRVAVGRANGNHVLAELHGRSPRAVASAVGQVSSSMVTSLSWRSGIVELSQFLTPASGSRWRLVWSPETRGQLTVRMEQ